MLLDSRLDVKILLALCLLLFFVHSGGAESLLCPTTFSVIVRVFVFVFVFVCLVLQG